LRPLAGFSLDEYTMVPVTYGNLSSTDVQRMEAEGVVDAWVIALPNGAGAPFVAALDEGAKTRGDGGSVTVDLSADYCFDESGWWRTGSWVGTLCEFLPKVNLSCTSNCV
jgi:N-acetyl-gamma-glutamyl-phosphate reductase/acetylglutamate kinase